jgi:hypothetical protein
MPSYDFKHPEKEEYIELFFSMNEEKAYIDEEGVEWKRVFTSPNVNATNRSYDPSKPIYDEKGNPMKVVPISDELIRSQGFDNAADYIEWNNSMVDETKTPLANTEKMHEQSRSKDVKELVKENEAYLKEQNKKAAQHAERSKSVTQTMDIVSQTDMYWDRSKYDTSTDTGLKKMQAAYDKEAFRATHRKVTVNDKEVANADKPKPKKNKNKKSS